jgi:hypothetical protein
MACKCPSSKNKSSKTGAENQDKESSLKSSEK